MKDWKQNHLNVARITAGVCYYPEHWGAEYWQNDLSKMRELGIEIARVGEFAWNFFEPREGHYEFSFFDSFLAEARRQGIGIIMCTPTCSPPAWLVKKHPEVLNATIEGNLYQHGMRQHHNMTSTLYLEKCDQLVTAMAEHYADASEIIGWQLDNEINCEINQYYAQSDHEAFRGWVKDKYQTLADFNRAMGADFWNQSYQDWAEVDLPGLTSQQSPNPHLMLEMKRFISHTAIQYLKRQADILQKYIGADIFITTNGIFDNLDYQQLLNDGRLNFITYDSYPNFAFCPGRDAKAEGAFNDRNTSYNLARVRNISPLFGIMEQQSGGGGWNTRLMQPAPKPGQLRLWTFQSVAHGADLISYFRFRTSDVGTEMYWTGIYDPDNRENRRVREVKKTISELHKLADIAGKPYLSSVGILQSYEVQWDSENDIFIDPLDKISQNSWFLALQKRHIPFNFVDFRNDTELDKLRQYEVLIAPHITMLTEAQAELLKGYAEAGGKLILGARSGTKNQNGHMCRETAPGRLRDLTGLRVEEYTVLGAEDEDANRLVWNGDQAVTEIPHLQEVLQVEAGEALAVYGGNHYAGSPALVRHKYGTGSVYYLGSAFSENTAIRLLEITSIESPLKGWLTLPWEAEVSVRGDAGKQYFFVLNYKSYEIKIELAEPAVDLLTGECCYGTIEMEPYGVKVLQTPLIP